MTPSSSTDTRTGFTVRQTAPGEGTRVAAFLARPDIDAAFQLPLSQRAMPIPERVRRAYDAGGTWLIAEDPTGVIVGCWSHRPEPDAPWQVSTSTLVVDPAARGLGVGAALWSANLHAAVTVDGVRTIVLHSWEGNTPVRQRAEATGFALIRRFPDETRRGPGGVTVVYAASAAVVRERLEGASRA
jgi:GNAT superfamily N-acetyltransferase